MLKHCNEVQLQILQIAELIESDKQPFRMLNITVDCPFCRGKMKLLERGAKYRCDSCGRSGELNELEDKLYDDTMKEHSTFRL